MPPARWTLPLAMVVAFGGVATAQRPLRSVLPADCLLVVEAPEPTAGVRALTRALGDVPEGLPADVVALVGVGLTVLRTNLGSATDAWVDTMARGGAAFALRRRGETVEPLLVVRPGDLEAAERWCSARGSQLHFARVDDLLVLAASRAGCDDLRRLAANPPANAPGGGDAAAAEPGPRGAVVYGRVDLEAVRQLLGSRAPSVAALDGGGRFLLGPIVHALAHGHWATFAVHAAGPLELHAEIDASVQGTPWAGLLPAPASPTDAPPRRLPLVPGGLARFTVDRSLRALLQTPARFLAEGDVVAVQSFLSIADVFDGARSSFVDDLLGGLREPLVLHVLPILAAEDGSSSPMALPGFVLTAPIANEAVVPVLRRTAQMLLTIVNAERQGRGQRPFLVRAVRSEVGEGLVAEAPPWRGPGLPPVELQLAPTVLWGHGHVVLASTREAAEQVLALAVEGAVAASSQPAAGDEILFRGPAIAAAIATNREVLELGRMLDEGEDQAQAQRFFAVLAVVAGSLQKVVLQSQVTRDRTRLSLLLERRR